MKIREREIDKQVELFIWANYKELNQSALGNLRVIYIAAQNFI